MSAMSAAASATAVVSEPPRPSVVTSLVCCVTPWKPATMATAPCAIALRIRDGRAAVLLHDQGHVGTPELASGRPPSLGPSMLRTVGVPHRGPAAGRTG